MALPTTIGQSNNARTPQTWEQKLSRRLPLFGHRNWIVVADAAYPAQSNPGIETIVTGAHHLQVVRTILDCIETRTHVRCNVYVDRELEFVAGHDAPGILEFREKLADLFSSKTIQRLPHEQIIGKLDQCAHLFRVLILKTDLTLPYTSVFFELDCGYWSAEAEERLRKAMQ